MSDPTLNAPLPSGPSTPSLADRILKSPDSIWKKIKEALKASTREAAAQMATSDESIAARVESLLAGEENVLGRAGKTGQTVLGTPKANKRSAADVMYGGGGLSI